MPFYYEKDEGAWEEITSPTDILDSDGNLIASVLPVKKDAGQLRVAIINEKFMGLTGDSVYLREEGFILNRRTLLLQNPTFLSRFLLIIYSKFSLEKAEH
ncbi:MAG: hypothetical protein PHG23_02975 [Candidatus Pacebacteria bacterium]|nr:hypothetical protein [Candidatus Paceibacterota bacterium]